MMQYNVVSQWFWSNNNCAIIVYSTIIEHSIVIEIVPSATKSDWRFLPDFPSLHCPTLSTRGLFLPQMTHSELDGGAKKNQIHLAIVSQALKKNCLGITFTKQLVFLHPFPFRQRKTSIYRVPKKIALLEFIGYFRPRTRISTSSRNSSLLSRTNWTHNRSMWS